MIQKPLNQITEDDLQALVTNGVSEGRQLEYKRDLPGTSDEAVKEFLKDVSGMANSAGGDIIYGIEEGLDESGNTVALNVVGVAGADADKVKLRVESLIRDCIKPRIIGAEIRDVRLSASTTVFVIRVPRSWTSPHVVDCKGHWRFYYRSTVATFPMDVSELRHAMTLSDTLAKRLEEFRLERIGRIAGDEKLARGAKVILHLQPFSSIQPNGQVDIRDAKRDYNNLRLLGSEASPTTRYNFEGLLAYQQSKESLGWLQIFRSGAIEAVDTDILEPSQSGEKTIPVSYFENALLMALTRYLSLCKNLLISPPVMLDLTLLGMRGYTIEFGNHDFNPRTYIGGQQLRSVAKQTPIDTEDLLLRSVVIEDLTVDAHSLLRGTFDTIWNAAGFKHSLFYDSEGRRIQYIENW